jgi:inner membrane protein
MDSLTQIALGAAVGEATLGKKIGNRAMLWGAFGGLLPDFDVFARFFTSEMSALAFHRGFMHSIVFAVIMAVILGGLVHRLYGTNYYRKRRYKAAVGAFILAIYFLLVLGIHFVFGPAVETPGWAAAVVVVASAIGLVLWFRYFTKELTAVSASRKDWMWLFFLSIVTHPILDCFTVFGTQIFLPFTGRRISFDNISVADPVYTIPLIIGLFVAALVSRKKKVRQVANWLGLGLSSAYMLFTFSHKMQVDDIFEKSLAAQGIEYTRYMTGPTILNNFLWTGVAEGDTAYYHGFYTFLGKEPGFTSLTVLPKNEAQLAGHEDEHTLRILKWFTKGYYNVITREDGRLQLNDLRYGSFDGSFENEKDYIFKFILEKKDGKLEARQSREGRKMDGNAFKEHFDRIMGK